jgi:predicted porin
VVGAGVTYTAGSSLRGMSGARYFQINLGTNYFLSKSTDIYAIAVNQITRGYDSTGRPAVAVLGDLSPAGGSRQFALVVGMQKSF